MLDRAPEGILRWHRALALVAVAAAILAPASAHAACNPASCDAVFACGFRECVANTCVTFPEPAGTVCRAAAGVCDRAETCNGSTVGCPSDGKRSAATICRPAVDACDGAETCDGVSNACTAPDVGVAPEILKISVVDSSLRFSTGAVNPNRFFEVRISGDQLCEATIDVDSLASPFELFRVSSKLLQTTRIGDADDFVPSGTVHFDINRGAVTGGLSYVPIDPDGPVEILSPGFETTLRGNPSFAISNQCTNCTLQELELIDDTEVRTLAEMVTTLPFDAPVEIALGDLGDALAPLPESRYVFEAEAIAGSLVQQSFAGDPSQNEFVYLSGRSIRNRLAFSVPEPGLAGAGLAAVGALLGIARLRRLPE